MIDIKDGASFVLFCTQYPHTECAKFHSLLGLCVMLNWYGLNTFTQSSRWHLLGDKKWNESLSNIELSYYVNFHAWLLFGRCGQNVLSILLWRMEDTLKRRRFVLRAFLCRKLQIVVSKSYKALNLIYLKILKTQDRVYTFLSLKWPYRLEIREYFCEAICLTKENGVIMTDIYFSRDRMLIVVVAFFCY